MDELNRLIQMATEAEALEHSALTDAPGEPRPIAAGAWRRTVWASLAGVSALAACLTVAFVALRGPAGTGGSVARDPRDAGGTVAMVDEPASEAPPLAATDAVPSSIARTEVGSGRRPELPDDTQSVVFALFRATDGSYECVQVDQPEWGHDRTMADVGRGDLMQVAFRNPCTTLAPQVILIGVQGRRGSVPTTLGDAQRIAERLRTVPMHHADVSSAAYAALPDLPAGSFVVAENVAIR